MDNIFWAFLWFIIIGGVFGVILAAASYIFKVPEEDERTKKVREALPGSNCGGCGYTGCGSYSEAVVKGEAQINKCTVGGKETAAEIALIMGKNSDKIDVEKYRAQVMCSGTNEYSRKKYIYAGATDCLSAVKMGGGDKLCPNGCIGKGSCVTSCKQNAISVKEGVAYVDYALCIGCGACVKKCPKYLIKLIPYKASYWVGCKSNQKAVQTKESCDVGCISCKLCEKSCPSNAIKVNDFVASIKYNECTGCGKCVDVCPRKIIWSGKTHTRGPIIKLNGKETDI